MHNASPSFPQTTIARSAGLVSAFAVLIVTLSLVGSFSALAGIPNLRLTQTPRSVSGTPTFAVGLEARVGRADPAAGEVLFRQLACAGCHLVDNGPGPYMVGIRERAATRRPDYSATAYLYESITNPNAFVVPEYQAGIMPQNFARLLTESQIEALVAWLLTQ
jgi:cytochrome c551/c552